MKTTVRGRPGKNTPLGGDGLQKFLVGVFLERYDQVLHTQELSALAIAAGFKGGITNGCDQLVKAHLIQQNSIGRWSTTASKEDLRKAAREGVRVPPPDPYKELSEQIGDQGKNIEKLMSAYMTVMLAASELEKLGVSKVLKLVGRVDQLSVLVEEHDKRIADLSAPLGPDVDVGGEVQTA